MSFFVKGRVNLKNKIFKIICLIGLLFFVGNLHVAEASNNENTSAKIGIIIPVYNSEKHLEECLDSCINQTHINIEIICVNDGSADSSLDILEKYALKDNRVKIINQENGGVSKARNTGIENSQGTDYIMFIDSDDFIDVKTCEVALNKALSCGADLVAFGFILFPKPENFHPWERGLLDAVYTSTQYDSFSYPYFSSACNKLYKRSLIVDNNVYFKEDVNWCEDDLFTLMVLPRTKITATISDKFYYHRKTPNDGWGTKLNLKKIIKNGVLRLAYLMDDYHKNNFGREDIISKKLSECINSIENIKD